MVTPSIGNLNAIACIDRSAFSKNVIFCPSMRNNVADHLLIHRLIRSSLRMNSVFNCQSHVSVDFALQLTRSDPSIGLASCYLKRCDSHLVLGCSALHHRFLPYGGFDVRRYVHLLDHKFSLDAGAGSRCCDDIEPVSVKKGKPTSDKNNYFVAIILDDYLLLESTANLGSISMRPLFPTHTLKYRPS